MNSMKSSGTSNTGEQPEESGISEIQAAGISLDAGVACKLENRIAGHHQNEEAVERSSLSPRDGPRGKGNKQHATPTKSSTKQSATTPATTSPAEDTEARHKAASGQTNISSKSQSNRRSQQKSANKQSQDHGKVSTLKTTTNRNDTQANSSTLDQFSARAQEIKKDIYDALERQSQIQIPDEPIEIVQLKNDILKLASTTTGANQSEDYSGEVVPPPARADANQTVDGDAAVPENQTVRVQATSDHCKKAGPLESEPDNKSVDLDNPVSQEVLQEPSLTSTKQQKTSTTSERNKRKTTAEKKAISNDFTKSISISGQFELGSFEPLCAKLDQETKYVSLVSSLRKDFEGSPGMLEPICKKLVQMSELIAKLQTDCENYGSENKKLLVIKQKLENLCRELQKSNNAIRIESLDLIKLEQGKAKEQTTKIQSTLSGVIKLFDENQQRNMTLRQENQELQTKLRSLLEHCDKWEKGFATTLRQRDIENRLLKTELAKANLLKNEEKEIFLKEKQELLKLLSMMQEHQSRIEGQEAKLRSDLSSYASKYDECQAVISQGMSKFQTESKKMLKQIEKSKQDYKVLLSKYESSNKKMAQLLDEKQRWDRSMNVANKKIETLEKLCRALREQKAEVNGVKNSQAKNTMNSSDKKTNKKAKAPLDLSQIEGIPVAEVSAIKAVDSVSLDNEKAGPMLQSLNGHEEMNPDGSSRIYQENKREPKEKEADSDQ